MFVFPLIILHCAILQEGPKCEFLQQGIVICRSAIGRGKMVEQFFMVLKGWTALG